MITEPMGGAWEFLGFATKVPEANIQAEFYYECRLLHIPCVLEYITPCGRHDLAIFNQRISHLLLIIECKGDRKRGYRQVCRYGQTGVPVWKLCSLAECRPMAQRVLTTFFGVTNPRGVPIESLRFTTPIPRRSARKQAKPEPLWVDPDLNFKST